MPVCVVRLVAKSDHIYIFALFSGIGDACVDVTYGMLLILPDVLVASAHLDVGKKQNRMVCRLVALKFEISLFNGRRSFCVYRLVKLRVFCLAQLFVTFRVTHENVTALLRRCQIIPSVLIGKRNVDAV